jgi:hypothetical protein
MGLNRPRDFRNLEISERGQIYFCRAAAAWICGIAEPWHGEDDDYATLRVFIKREADIEEKRNQITHSIWGAGNDANIVTRIKTTVKEKHGIRFHFEDVIADTLAAVADEIKVLAEDIQRLHFSLLERGKVINNPGRKLW